MKLTTLTTLVLLLCSGCATESYLTVRANGLTAPLTLKLAEKAAKAHSSYCDGIGADVEVRHASVRAFERKGMTEASYLMHSQCARQ